MDTDSDMMVPSAPVETTPEEDYYVPPPPPDELILVRLTHAHEIYLQHPGFRRLFLSRASQTSFRQLSANTRKQFGRDPMVTAL